MASPRRTTTQQGLGWEHQKARARALREMQEGEPCPFCAEPMSKDEPLDYDHVIPRSQGGTDGPRRLSHASCNRQAGGRLGARVTNGRKRVVASPQVRPAPGGACYRCGTPMLERQAAVCESATLGAGPVWRHGACPIRYVSVPVDRL